MAGWLASAWVRVGPWSGKKAAAALLSVVLLLPALAFAQPKFPPLTGRVVDDAQLLSPATEGKLTDELAALEQKTGHQLVVATVPSLQGYEIEDYGYQLGRTWALGRKGQNDGAILLVAPKERKVRIEVGYGLEPVLTDALSSLIIQRAVLPRFKAGDYEQGIVQGTEAVVAQLGLPPDEAKARVAEAEAQRDRIASRDGDGGRVGIPIVFVIFVVFWVLSGILRLFGGRRRYGGSGLWWPLPFLLSGSGRRNGGGWSSGGWSGGGGGGGFSGGGGSFGGGGASGSW